VTSSSVQSSKLQLIDKANSSAVLYGAIHCLHWWSVGPALQHADIPYHCPGLWSRSRDVRTSCLGLVSKKLSTSWSREADISVSAIYVSCLSLPLPQLTTLGYYSFAVSLRIGGRVDVTWALGSFAIYSDSWELCSIPWHSLVNPSKCLHQAILKHFLSLLAQLRVWVLGLYYMLFLAT